MIELAVIGALALFATVKGVDMWKHSETLDADRYAQCVKHAEDVRECRSLED